MNKFNFKLNKENNFTLNKKLLDCIPVLRKSLINPWYKNNFFTCNRSVSIFNNTQLKIAPDLNDSTKELFNIIHKTYIKVKNSKKKYIPCINKLQNHNWMFPIDQLLNTNLINEINNLPDDKIESFMLDYYSKDEFYFVKETFRDILKNLNGTSDKRKQGYMKMIFQMLKAFKRDSDNFILCIPCLFVIIEHLTLITDDYKSYQKNKKNHKKNVNYRYFNDKHIEIQGTFNDGQLQDYTNANHGYNMKSGDILIVHGSDDLGQHTFVGHAAIATSAGYVVHMPGSDYRSECWSKEHFFKHYANSHSHVWVYRIKNHPHYADDASTYAWNMHKNVNPSYYISTNLLHKDPSYCSKFVFLSYYWGATKDSMEYDSAISVLNFKIIHPFALPDFFSDSFHPTCIHKIVGY